MAFTFHPEEKELLFSIKDFSPDTQRLLMSTLDVNGLIADLQAFKLVVSSHLSELINDPSKLELAQQVAYKGQVLPLLRDETNALNFELNSYRMYMSDVGKEATYTRRILVDFDGTITDKAHGRDIGNPMKGAKEALQVLKNKGYKIVIFSVRANSDSGKKQIADFLTTNNIPFDGIEAKPNFDFFIDDKAISIGHGSNWEDVLEEVGSREKVASTHEAISTEAALAIGNEIAKVVAPALTKHEFVGAVRRKASTTHDIDILAIGDPSKVVALIEKNFNIKPTVSGEAIVRFIYKGILVDFFFIHTPEEWGAALLYRTGPSTSNIAMRAKAKHKGWKLNEHGLFDEHGNLIPAKTEQDIYKALDMEYYTPEQRQERFAKEATYDPQLNESVNSDLRVVFSTRFDHQLSIRESEIRGSLSLKVTANDLEKSWELLHKWEKYFPKWEPNRELIMTDWTSGKISNDEWDEMMWLTKNIPMKIHYVDPQKRVQIFDKGQWETYESPSHSTVDHFYDFLVQRHREEGDIRPLRMIEFSANYEPIKVIKTNAFLYSPLSQKESAFLPSLPGVVWETHDGPDMQHSPSTPLEMLHPVNQDNTYDTYTTIHDKKDPADLIHFLSLEDKEKKLNQPSDAKEADESNEAQNNIETALGKRDIAKQAITNEEHLTHIKGLVNQRQFEKAVNYIGDNKLNAPKLLKDLEERSSKATILNKDQALLLLQKGSTGAQSNAVKWLSKHNDINELAAAMELPEVALSSNLPIEIINAFKENKNVIVLNRLFNTKSIPEGVRRHIVETLEGMKYTPIVDEAVKDDSEQIRSAGYKAASRLKDKFHLLDRGIEDPSAKIRREVYSYLWEAQTPTALDLFYKGQKDADPMIQKFVKDKIGISKGQTSEPTLKGDELTKKMIEEGITNAQEYFKKHPELNEKLQKELKEREETIRYNQSLFPPKQSSINVEAIQPPAGVNVILEPAFEWGERDDGLLARDVKQYYGRPKSEFRNNMNLLPTFLDQKEDKPMDKEADFFPQGSFFKLKEDLMTSEGKKVLPKGHRGLVLWRDPTVPSYYVVRFEGIQTRDGDIGIPEKIMEPLMPSLPREAASNVYDDFEQSTIDNDRRLQRTEDDEGVLIMDRDWISDTQTFPRGKPLPPARWTDPDRLPGEVGGEKLPQGPTYWEPSPGNLDCMPASNTISFTIDFHQDGGKVSCTWDKEDVAPNLDEHQTVQALIRFIQTNLPHALDKFKNISPEHVDLHNRTIVLKFHGKNQEHNEKN